MITRDSYAQSIIKEQLQMYEMQHGVKIISACDIDHKLLNIEFPGMPYKTGVIYMKHVEAYTVHSLFKEDNKIENTRFSRTFNNETIDFEFVVYDLKDVMQMISEGKGFFLEWLRMPRPYVSSMVLNIHADKINFFFKEEVYSYALHTMHNYQELKTVDVSNFDSMSSYQVLSWLIKCITLRINEGGTPFKLGKLDNLIFSECLMSILSQVVMRYKIDGEYVKVDDYIQDSDTIIKWVIQYEQDIYSSTVDIDGFLEFSTSLQTKQFLGSVFNQILQYTMRPVWRFYDE